MEPAPDSPILLFDSGLGGLSVLAELRRELPDAPIIYAADIAGLPYGEKTEAEIAARVAGLLGRMSERFGPRLICIACNTASTIALGMVRNVLHVPIVGTVPAIKPAAAVTQTGTIGLLGTAATIRQAYVDDLEARFAADNRLIRYAAPGLVGAAETKLRGGRPDDAVFADAIAGLRRQPDGENIDTVVLACTHFPLVEEELRAAIGPEVTFIHGAEGIARRIASLTLGQQFQRNGPDRAIATGEIDSALVNTLAQYGLENVAQF
ncbi:glutamate racemase [Aurantiacibacter atlanticus]|uniref:Glutamate racemase n=1 Tax=Aurantiacibacter atlanticus TaxID=1648404 RepID=A0A0H4VY96_9SPHN|nr:glutamate racemase [Aurantiacibacter atlanticus]AKQ42118.1 glutamate racemase [Aurantiacibacter atlanticus]MDF1834199.1 glutamate racemase [Alteraurantiacibacter sp. bin_em_oilr2.035]